MTLSSVDKNHGKPGHLCSSLCGAAMLREAEEKGRCMAAKFLYHNGDRPSNRVAVYAHCDRASHEDEGAHHFVDPYGKSV